MIRNYIGVVTCECNPYYQAYIKAVSTETLSVLAFDIDRVNRVSYLD